MGISAARELATIGFTQNVNDDSPDYPINEIMSTLKPDTRLSTASIPSARISSGEKWSLFESLTGDPAELARQVVTIGPEKALARCPVRKFGGMLSVERAEQEREKARVRNRRDASVGDQRVHLGLLQRASRTGANCEARGSVANARG